MRRSLFLFLVIVSFVSWGQLATGTEKAPRVHAEKPSERFLRDAPVDIEKRFFGEADRRACEKFLSRAQGTDKLPYLIIMAQYERIMVQDPLRGMELLGPFVLDDPTFQVWKAANAKARTEMRTAGEAKRSSVPELLVPFPVVQQWKISTTNLSLAFEMARLHIAMGKFPEAMRIADHIGATYEGIYRIRAGECAGDVMMGDSKFSKSVEFYEYALQGFRTLKSGGDGNVLPEYLADKARIEASLAKARSMLEIEAYGPGYIRYREARRCDKTEGRIPEAILLYEDLDKAFPKTVYGEAGKAYACESLLWLADPSHAKSLTPAIQKATEGLQRRQALLTQAKRLKVPSQILPFFEADVDVQRTWLDRLKNLPAGPAAAKEAERRGMELLSKNEFGLYRGEVLVAMATYSLEQDMDAEKAQSLYDRAWEWLSRVNKVDVEMDSYEVPEKARQVSRPPQDEDQTDYFGNIKRMEPGPEAIVNRRTCRWYLDDLREKTALALGFICFYRKENDQALAWYGKVINLDQKTRYLETHNEWNNYRRLKWGAEHGYLFAHPSELKLFEKRQRLAVLMGDFYYTTERFDEAKDLYGRLSRGEFGKLSPDAADYPQYAYAACVYWLEGRQNAFPEYLNVLARKSGSFTEDRAAYAAGNIAGEIPQKEIQQQGLDLLRVLAESGRSNDFVYRAMITCGRRLLKAGKEKEGIRMLSRLPKSTDGYYKLAQMYLHEYREKKESGAKERNEGKT